MSIKNRFNAWLEDESVKDDAYWRGKRAQSMRKSMSVRPTN